MSDVPATPAAFFAGMMDFTEPTTEQLRQAALDRWAAQANVQIDAWPESTLKGEPGSLLARREQAVCRATRDGALWIGHVQREVARARIRIADIGRANGLQPLVSATNFVTIDCGRDGDYAGKVLAELGRRGVFIRMPGIAPLDRCIRISLGDGQALDILEETLPLALKAAG